MHCNNDDLYRVRDNRLSRLICSFVHFILLLSIVANVKFFVREISGIVKAKASNLVCNAMMMTYIVWETRGFLGLFVHLFFHSSFSPYRPMLIFFVKDFSGTIKARSLKLGRQRNNDDLYRVRDSGLSKLICSFVLSFFFLSILANGKFLSKISLEL